MNKELKLCPFCGGKATIREFATGHKGSGEFTASYQCGCQKCKIYFIFDSSFMLENGQPKFMQNGYEKCVEMWNMRNEKMIEFLLKVLALIFIGLFLFLRNKERKEFIEKENEIAELRRKAKGNT